MMVTAKLATPQNVNTSEVIVMATLVIRGNNCHAVEATGEKKRNGKRNGKVTKGNFSWSESIDFERGDTL
jgi:hypothetical protein